MEKAVTLSFSHLKESNSQVVQANFNKFTSVCATNKYLLVDSYDLEDFVHISLIKNQASVH